MLWRLVSQDYREIAPAEGSAAAQGGAEENAPVSLAMVQAGAFYCDYGGC